MPRDLTYRAPIGSVDLLAEGEFWPCSDCLPWHFEVVRRFGTDEFFVREWHAVDCPTFRILLDEE